RIRFSANRLIGSSPVFRHTWQAGPPIRGSARLRRGETLSPRGEKNHVSIFFVVPPPRPRRSPRPHRPRQGAAGGGGLPAAVPHLRRPAGPPRELHLQGRAPLRADRVRD